MIIFCFLVAFCYIKGILIQQFQGDSLKKTQTGRLIIKKINRLHIGKTRKI